MDTPFKLVLSAGELSGDEHGAHLLKEIKALYPQLECRAMGGANIEAQGAELVIDHRQLGSVMGFSELFGKLFELRSALKRMCSLLDEYRPDLLVLVDYPDFNLRLAKYAHSRGIKVAYFISPKLWAWRKRRIEAFKKYVDHLIAIFPFEEEYFKSRGFDRITYVGHPLAWSLNSSRNSSEFTQYRATFLAGFGIDPSAKVVVVLPGSRPAEIKKHLPVLIETLRSLHECDPTICAIISMPTKELQQSFAGDWSHLRQHEQDYIKFIPGEALDLMRYGDFGLIKSGTSNLQALVLELPFIMFFKTSALSAWLVRRLIALKEYSIVNLLMPGTVPEVLQEQFNPSVLSQITLQHINAPEKKCQMLERFIAIKDHLLDGKESPYLRAAKVISSVASQPQRRSRVREMFALLKPYRSLFAVAMVCMVLFGATDGAIPFLVKEILDGVFANQDRELLILIPILLLIFAVFRGVVDFGQQYLNAKVGHLIVRDLRNSVNRKLLTLSSGFFLRQSSADLLSRITSDVILVRTVLTETMSAVLRDLVRVVALLAVALYLDPWLALIALVGFPLGFYPIYRFGRKLRKLSRLGQEAIGSLSSILQESILGQRVVKSFGREQFEIDRFNRRNEELTKTFLKSEKVRALTGPVNEVLASAAIAGVVLYGGLSVIGGVRSQGDFIAFLIAVFLLYDPFKKLSRVNATVQQGLIGAERIFDILDKTAEVQDPIAPVPLNASSEVEFRNVGFSYGSDSALVLKDINLIVPDGKMIALVGLSGAGKTTLVDMLPRFIDPAVGKVLIGGIDISKVRLCELRSRISMVSQHTFLFNDTIYNNIAYGNSNASVEAVENAARAAFAYDFIVNAPAGFETMIGEGGYALSGGQRQRIAIARAILKDAPILILDEATAALDSQSEREVQAAIESLRKGRTSLVIAHRLSTVRDADIIVVMKDGQIIERGTHAELMGQGSEYAKLHSLQFSDTKSNDQALVN